MRAYQITTDSVQMFMNLPSACVIYQLHIMCVDEGKWSAASRANLNIKYSESKTTHKRKLCEY